MEWKVAIDHIDDVDRALSLFDGSEGGEKEFTTEQLKRALLCATGMKAKDDHLAIVLAVFDDDGNGKLSRAEFGDVLRKTASLGLSKPRDLGLVRLLSCCSSCLSDAVAAKLQ